MAVTVTVTVAVAVSLCDIVSLRQDYVGWPETLKLPEVYVTKLAHPDDAWYRSSRFAGRN